MTTTPDTQTSAGCAQILADLRHRLHAQDLRQREIEAERDRLALPAALKRDAALGALRDLAEEEALLAASAKNLKAAIREAERLQAEAESREAFERKGERWDRAAELRAAVLALAVEIDDAFNAIAGIVRRHDEAANELVGLGLLDEGAKTYLAGAGGVPGAVLAAGLGPAFPQLKPTIIEAVSLATRHRQMIGLPSRERFMEAMP